MKMIFASLLLIYTQLAHAYIPPYWMILSRTADNHGKGLYVVDQDVQFQHNDELWIVREKWLIMNEQNMRLEVTGKRQLKDQIRLTYVYQNGKRYFIDENGVKKAETVTADFFEPYFHFRLSRLIKPILVSEGISPSISLKSAPFKYTEKNPTPEPEPYVRLARTGGLVAYAIGTPTPVSSSEDYPGLWIAQDQFNIIKLRLKSQLEINAADYGSYANDLKFPKSRSVTWDKNRVIINVNNVSTSSRTTTVKEALDYSSLNFGKNPELSRQLPADEVVKEFYSRMR